MMDKNKSFKMAKVVIGLLSITLGIVLSLQVNMGASPYDVMNQGIQRTLGVPPEKIGNVAIVVGIILTFIAALIKTLFNKKNEKKFFQNISWGAIVIGISMGWMINIWYMFVSVNEGQFIFTVIAVYLLSFGIAIIAKQKIIADPMTTVMMEIMDCGVGVIQTRVIIDGSMVVIGFILGGTVGIGTILFLLFLGILVNFNLKYLKFL